MKGIGVRWILISAILHMSYGIWTEDFDYRDCYEKRMEERMPLSIDNIIALMEHFEREDMNTSPEDIAEMIVQRYRQNGIVYDPTSTAHWTPCQTFETKKQSLDNRLLKPELTFPTDSFIPREECSLHMSVSHSTDLYPHAGVDTSWDNSKIYYRKKRQAFDAASEEGSDSYYGPDIGNTKATHPMENGVIQTASGPVATGLLLSGIMKMTDSKSYTISELIGKRISSTFMPSEMSSKKIDQLYGSTISGKLGESAIMLHLREPEYKFEIGPRGRFGNCSSCGRIFSLENPDYSYYSRAEVFGSLDGFIVARTMYSRSDVSSIKLSEILRMYYSDHGLYNEDIKACNRIYVYKKMIDSYRTEIKDQALNYMYAYASGYDTLREEIKFESFAKISDLYSGFLEIVFEEFESFLSNYGYDDAERCPTYNDKDAKLESETDLVVVFTPVGTTEMVDKQAQYISATARKIGVGYHRSMMAIFNGRTMDWLAPMTNYTNIADYSCNYTTFMNYGTTSSQDFIEVLDKLTVYYNAFYQYLRSSNEHTGSRSQVVMWNLPDMFNTPSDEYAVQDAWDNFNMSFPDVNIVFVGNEPANFFNSIFREKGNNGQDDKITIVPNSSPYPLEIANEIVDNIRKSPRMFIYPSCDTSNSSLYDYNENSHKYTNFVSPNFTTVIRIPPQNFHYSETLKLSFDRSDTQICVSRKVLIPSSSDPKDLTDCKDGTSSPTFEDEYLCDRYVEDCDPIYISVKGENSGTDSYCSNKKCNFPNQIEFTMTHEGMICGCWALLPTPLLLLAVTLLHYFKF